MVNCSQRFGLVSVESGSNMADLAVDMAHMLTSLLTWIGLKLARPKCDVS